MSSICSSSKVHVPSLMRKKNYRKRAIDHSGIVDAFYICARASEFNLRNQRCSTHLSSSSCLCTLRRNKCELFAHLVNLILELVHGSLVLRGSVCMVYVLRGMRIVHVSRVTARQPLLLPFLPPRRPLRRRTRRDDRFGRHAERYVYDADRRRMQRWKARAPLWLDENQSRCRCAPASDETKSDFLILV